MDTVRALVQWTRVVPGPNATRRPPGLDPANPRTYPPEVWDPYDDLVRGARARGLDVLLSPAGPVPLWATPCRSGTPERRRTCKPSAREFEAFVTALARRFSGSLRRREPARRAPAGGALVGVERAQPAGLAEPAVRARRRPRGQHGGAALPRPRARRHPRARHGRPRRRRGPARRDGAGRAHGRHARAQRGAAGVLPARPAVPRPPRARPARPGGARSRLPRLHAARGDGLRPPPLHARRLAAAAVGPRARRDHRAQPRPPDHAARPRGAAAADRAPAARALHGVRLPDPAARRRVRRPAGAAGGLPRPVRVARLPHPARAGGGAVQARRRPGRRGLPVGPALRGRPREAGAHDVPAARLGDPDGLRRTRVGPGAPGRRRRPRDRRDPARRPSRRGVRDGGARGRGVPPRGRSSPPCAGAAACGGSAGPPRPAARP